MIKKLAYYLIILVFASSCAQQSEDTIRLIPEGYLGTVMIIFNQKNGEAEEYEDGKRVYRIPETGILYTQFEPNYGIQKHEYFYLDTNGNRTEIDFLLLNSKEKSLEEVSNDKVYAYFEYALGRVRKFDPDTKELLYTIQPARTFFLGNAKDIDEDYRKQENFTFEHHNNRG